MHSLTKEHQAKTLVTPERQGAAVLTPPLEISALADQGPRQKELMMLKASIALKGKNKCGSCQHLRLLHFKNKCSQCDCVSRPRPGNWQFKDIQQVYDAVVEGAKY